MSFSGGTSTNVLLLFDNGNEMDQVWLEYIEESLKRTLTVECRDFNTPLDEVSSSYKNYTVIVMILSPDTPNLSASASKWKRCFAHHGHIVALTLCLTQEEIDANIKPKFRSSESWTYLELGEDAAINDAAMEEINKIVRQSMDPVVKPKTPGTGRHSSRGQKKFDVRFYPDSVRQHEETILMCLRKPIPEGQTVQISVDVQTAPKMDTHRINPYSFTFKAPHHAKGKAHIYVFVDGNKRFRHTLRYPAPWIQAYTCPQFLCQLLGKEDLSGLDRCLASIYSDSIAQDDCLGDLLTPKNIVANTGERKSSDQLPTLLHFACHYGLEDLCKNIVEMTPGVEHVFDICNCDDKTPIALAEDSDHQDLVAYLEQYNELVSYVSNLNELYVKMDRLEAGDVLEDGYVGMDHHSTAPLIDQGYTEARVPSSNLCGRGHSSGVSEVMEEEDVQEQKPVVPVRTPRTTLQATPPVVPRRPPQSPRLPETPLDSQQFLQVVEPLSPMSMGSRTLEEVKHLQQALKDGDLTEEEVARFFDDWKTRYRSSGSASMKERRDQLKEFAQSNEKIMKKVKPKGFFSRFSKSKKPEKPALEIKHNVQPNQYDAWGSHGRPADCESTIAHFGGIRPGRESTISNISTSSSSSSGSRDSALDTVPEDITSSSDDEFSQSYNRDCPQPPVFSRSPGPMSPPTTHAPPPPGAQAPPQRGPKRSRLPPPPKNTEFILSSTPPVPPRPPKR